uniref:Uncharacterized protein n=1 Tax=viral metagenome TaxID=1070528 RepID=A0A6M3J9V9_9ZZZZ
MKYSIKQIVLLSIPLVCVTAAILILLYMYNQASLILFSLMIPYVGACSVQVHRDFWLFIAAVLVIVWLFHLSKVTITKLSK